VPIAVKPILFQKVISSWLTW